MTAKTTAERVAALRERREAQGLVRLELFAHPDDHVALKLYALSLQAERAKVKLKERQK
jgi:hypothetical protein